jgi:outer membrane protein assembly factor BamB
MMRIPSKLAAAAALATLVLSGADWPQWRGPDRTAVSKETGLLRTWPKGGPKLLWKFENAGNGYACEAVVGGVLYTMGGRGATEYLFALDNDGKELWATKIGPVFDFMGNQWSRGPNSTPTVDGDLVFALGSQGMLVCVEKAGGKLVWSKDLPKELAAEVNPVGGGPKKFGWGYSWSPLVDGGKLIIVPGGPKGLFAALDKKKGDLLWRSKDVTDQATYSSPIAATIGGVKQYIHLTQIGPVAVSADRGELLWRYNRDMEYADVLCPTPIVSGDEVYVSVGYGGGADLFKINGGKKFDVKVVYSKTEDSIGTKQGGVVKVGDFVYGYDEDSAWVCQEFATGEQKWRSGGGAPGALKAGGVIAADGLLLLCDEKGEVAALEASPRAYKEVGRFTLPQKSKIRKIHGGIWTHPVLSDGRLYLRDQELIFCYEVK